MTNRSPYYISLVCYYISFILFLVAFSTSHWYDGADPNTTFRRIGLWEACFSGYQHTSDYIGKAYYGCWYVFHKEYWYIRDWIMPPWFIAVQTMMSFAICLEFVTIVTLPLARRDRKNVYLLSVNCLTTILTTFLIMISVVIFGSEVGEDRTWMPRFDINHLGYSFGVAVVSGFMAAFSAIAICVYTLMRKYELIPEKTNLSSKSTNVMAMLPRA